MRLIWSKTLSKVFLEVLIHADYLNESFNLSLNVTGTFHVYLWKMNPQMESAETKVHIVSAAWPFSMHHWSFWISHSTKAEQW